MNMSIGEMLLYAGGGATVLIFVWNIAVRSWGRHYFDRNIAVRLWRRHCFNRNKVSSDTDDDFEEQSASSFVATAFGELHGTRVYAYGSDPMMIIDWDGRWLTLSHFALKPYGAVHFPWMSIEVRMRSRRIHIENLRKQASDETRSLGDLLAVLQDNIGRLPYMIVTERELPSPSCQRERLIQNA